MGVVPRKFLDRIQFYKSRLAAFETNAAAIGLSAPEVTDLETKVDAALALHSAHLDAQIASKTATEAFYNAVNLVTVAGSAALKKIRAQAEITGNPEVYVLAQIPAPATPQPKGDPGTPAELKVELNGNGALILSWKCVNPPGVMGTFYQVYRNDAGDAAGPFTALGVAAVKMFVDETVPAGATKLVYKIRAIRTTAGGLWATFNVIFGANTGGGATVTAAADTSEPKLAA